MRGAMWMALAFLGTPLAALAQTQGTAGQQTMAGPSGAASVEQGQESVNTPGSFGVFGGPAVPGLGGVPVANQPSTGAWWEGGTGGSGLSDSIGPTYRGTTPMPPSASPSDESATPSDTTSPSIAPSRGASARAPGTASPGNAGSGNAPIGQGDVAALRQRVDALEREVTTIKGTGGSGIATGTAQNDSQSDDSEPVTVVTVEFDGTVRDVTSKHIDVVDRTDGTLSRLTIDKQTRVYRGSKRISPKQISEGARVRTSFAYISGVEHARDIVVQSTPRKSQR